MRHPIVAAAVAASALLAPASALAAPPADVAAAVAKGAAFLRTQQDPATGKLTGFGDDWAVSALAAAGVHPADVRVGAGPSAQDGYLALWTSDEWVAGAANSSRAALNAIAAGLQPTRLGARSNLVAELAAQQQADGGFGDLNATAFSVLALSRTKVPQPVLARGAAVVRANVHDDGGWDWGNATTPAEKAAPGDIDMTGAAIAALCASGASTSDPAVAGGLAFLRARLLPASGAFDANYGANADSNAWAISGLNECGVDPQSAAWTTTQGKTPVDYVLAQQAAAGGFRASWEGPTDPGNVFTTQNAVRALAGESFSAAPVGGRVRAGATVADGTPVPTVLAIDNGKGDARLCRVTAPVGASVVAVLRAADCVHDLVVTDGRVTSLDGATPDNPRGGWVASVDGGPEAFAAGQRVGFGDIVSVRLQHTPLPGMLSAAAVDFGGQTVGTVGAAKSVTFTAGGSFPVTPTRAVTTGDDFLIAEDGCAETTLQPGESCTVRVRFAPSEAGARTGAVKLLGDAVATATVSGTGTVLAAAPAPAPVIVAGTPGPKGDTGARGPRGHAAKVTCKTVGTKRRSVRCTLKANGKARLTRKGKVVARGTSTTLRASKRVARGVYTLRVGNLRVQVRIA